MKPVDLKSKHILTIVKKLIMRINNVVNDLNREEMVGTFFEKELQKTNQKEIRIEKVIKRKGNKLYVKWKGYKNSFNSWIVEKDIV